MNYQRPAQGENLRYANQSDPISITDESEAKGISRNQNEPKLEPAANAIELSQDSEGKASLGSPASGSPDAS